VQSCHGCGAEISSSEKILRTTECPRCGADLHCCRNCRHYHSSAHNQCLEPVAEWVAEKEKANFCDYFSFAQAPVGAGRSDGSSAAARQRWESLFKPGSGKGGSQET